MSLALSNRPWSWMSRVTCTQSFVSPSRWNECFSLHWSTWAEPRRHVYKALKRWKSRAGSMRSQSFMGRLWIYLSRDKLTWLVRYMSCIEHKSTVLTEVYLLWYQNRQLRSQRSVVSQSLVTYGIEFHTRKVSTRLHAFLDKNCWRVITSEILVLRSIFMWGISSVML